MSTASRELKVGARVTTHYSGRVTFHTITERSDGRVSQSGVMYRVSPLVPKSSRDWLNADWFEPAVYTTDELEAADQRAIELAKRLRTE